VPFESIDLKKVHFYQVGYRKLKYLRYAGNH